MLRLNSLHCRGSSGWDGIMPASSHSPRSRRNNRSTTRATLAAHRAAARRGRQETGRLDWARRVELGTVVVAAVVAVGGLWYTNVQAQQANEQALKADAQAKADLSLATEDQVTERYTAAVENLGHDKVDVRLGGIYGLQRIMKDSPRDQPTIGNILAAYVRTNASKPPAKGQELPADVDAAFMVLGTRDRKHDGDFRLDLREARLPRLQAADFPEDESGVDLSGGMLLGIDLSEAFLPSANLSRSWLSGANLFRTSLPDSNLSHAMLLGANMAYANLTKTNLTHSSLSSTHLNSALLRGSNLSHASFSFADLSKANLRKANLTKADLARANLSKADLSGTKMTDASFFETNLSGAELTGADLSGADLSTVKNLTQEQVSSARTDGTTQLPPGLTRVSPA
ncbi:pentapeptide repeat-containing protein [Streptomyces albidoflavus]